MPKPFDAVLLTDFAHTFYGYSAYHAPYWFIGMEEACDGNIDGLQRRFATWRERDSYELEDVKDLHVAFGNHRLAVPCVAVSIV